MEWVWVAQTPDVLAWYSKLLRDFRLDPSRHISRNRQDIQRDNRRPNAPHLEHQRTSRS